MRVTAYRKKCEYPNKEAEGLITDLEAAFSRSAMYAYNSASAYFINISLTKSYLRVMKRLCANISLVVEQGQISAWVTIIKSEINKEFGPFYESAYADFHKRIEDCFDKHDFEFS